MKTVATVEFKFDDDYTSTDELVHEVYTNMLRTRCRFRIVRIEEHFEEVGRHPYELYENIELGSDQ